MGWERGRGRGRRACIPMHAGASPGVFVVGARCGMSGLDLVKAARARWPHPRVIFYVGPRPDDHLAARGQVCI